MNNSLNRNATILQKKLFVNSPTGICAIIENSNVSGTRKQKVWHTYTDHLGSLVYLENADSTAEKREYSYDAWGNLRNHADWLDDDPDYDLIADRGYTGHEHLTEFGLINMNGRVYDPVVGRFLSVDPFVQKPGYVDGYNRYSYVSNNPLRYVDPSGYAIAGDGWRDYAMGMWGIKPQQDSGHGMVGGGTTSSSAISPNNGASLGFFTYVFPKNTYIIQLTDYYDVTIDKTTMTGYYTYEYSVINDIKEERNGFFPDPPPATNGGGYHYGNLGQFSTWLESAGFTVVNKVQKTTELNRQLNMANNLSLWEVTAKDIKYVKQGSKLVGFLGPAGDGVNISLILADGAVNGLDAEFYMDLVFAGIGCFPIIGDGIAFMYMVAPEMDRMMEERPDIFIQHNINVNNFKCFVGGSQVSMADGTFKNIESVQIEDSVLTYNFENQELEINPVLHIDVRVHHKLVTVVFSNGEEIVSTEDHPYYVKGKGWCSFNPQQTQKNYNIQTGQLEVSDYCLTHKRNKLKKVKILQIEPLEESVRTYNLTKIKNSDNYFVNGILVNTESNTKQ